MTNAEKFKEVFGFDVDYDMCPRADEDCAVCVGRGFVCERTFWLSDYQGEPTIPLSVKEALEKEADSLSQAYKEEHEKWKSLMLAIEKIKAEIKGRVVVDKYDALEIIDRKVNGVNE